jgi:hypothetical protein
MTGQTSELQPKKKVNGLGHSDTAIVRVILFVAMVLVLVSCSSHASAPDEVRVQAALPTPTLEPTFTPVPPPTSTPQPSPTATPAEPTPTPTPQSLLSGRILDEGTNQPIAGAKVSVGTATAATDAEGRYTLTGLPPGQYVLSITHPGYDPGLSSIFTLAAGQEQSLDLTLYAPDTSPYPKDPMLTNPLDPNGAPTIEDAERLARLQGLTGEVVNIRETTLSGEYLVNYKIGDEVRAAVAELNHEVWELTDDAGRAWWILKVCGNLASLLPQEAPIATPKPIALAPMAEVLGDGLIVRECAADECAQVATGERGAQIEVVGCTVDGGWCHVRLRNGNSGWCSGRSLRHLAVAQTVPVVGIVLPTPILTTPPQLASTTPMAGQNVLNNASFEQDPAANEPFWYFDSLGTDASASWTSERAHSGQRSLSLSASHSANRGWPGWFSALLPVERGFQYTFEAMYFTPDGAGGWIDIWFLEADGTRLLGTGTPCVNRSRSPTTSWQRLRFSVPPEKVPASAAVMRLGLRQCLNWSEGTMTTVYYDDVSFIISSP